MKANELMIGDWVRIDEPDKYAGATGQIHSLMYHREDDAAYFNVFIQGKFGYVSRDVCSDDIRPITLTAEILEKNGFVPKFSDGCLTDYLIYKDIVDGLHEMYTRIVYFNTKEKEHKLECFDCRTGGCQIWIKFVHELQHALRLCGIDKTIEL